jgi:hypothetical protein
MRRKSTRPRRATAAAVALLALTACGGGGPDDGAEPTAGSPAANGDAAPSPSPSPAPSPTALAPEDADDDDPGHGAGGDDGGDDGSDGHGSAGSEGASPDFQGGTSARDPGGAQLLTVTGVRVAQHAGFDRVVFDLGGRGSPGWDVAYVDGAVDDGSGERVDVDGESILSVRIRGTAMPMDSGVEEYGGTNIDLGGTDAVEEVVYRFGFEGDTTAFIGVDDERAPFRVFALEDPKRVVVDIQH